MDVEELSISLPSDMADMVRSHVESGAYSSNSELIRDALRLWQQREKERVDRIDAIRDEIAKAARNPERITAQEMRQHFDDRLARAEATRNP